MSEQILKLSGTSGPCGRSIKNELWRLGDHRPRSREAQDRFRSMMDASFSTPLGQVDFVVDQFILYIVNLCIANLRNNRR